MKAEEIWERTRAISTRANILEALGSTDDGLTINSIRTLAGGHSHTVPDHVRKLVKDGVVEKVPSDESYPRYRLRK